MAASLDPTHSPAPAGSGAMFDGIAERYDLLNRLISLGIDQNWRALAVRELGDNPRCVLDLATGTADLALRIAETFPNCHVTGIDPSVAMLNVGQRKVAKHAAAERVQLLVGDAQKLPFEDRSFDAVSIAFGIRNVPDRAQALAEMARVTRPAGRVVVLELSEPRRGVVASLARWHMHTLVPLLGGLLSGQREYRYLPNSIRAFPPPAEFERMLAQAGLCRVRSRALTFGVCQLYVAEVP